MFFRHFSNWGKEKRQIQRFTVKSLSLIIYWKINASISFSKLMHPKMFDNKIECYRFCLATGYSEESD